MNIAEKKIAAGFRAPSQRDRCGNCEHREHRYADRTPPWDRAWLACKLNDFAAVSAGAICDAFAPDGTTSTSPPAPRFN